MQYERNRPSGSSSGLIVGLLLLLVLGGIGILGLGTYVWLRSESAARQAVVREQAAMAAQAAQQARMQAEQRTSEADLPSVDVLDVVPPNDAEADATVTVDRDGGIALHGRPMGLDELTAALRDLADYDGGSVAVTILADEACAFRHVAAVIRAARASGVASIQVAVPEGGDTAEAVEQD